MDIDNELLNKLLEKDLEWGPDTVKPLIERTQILLKDYNQDEQIQIVNYIKNVSGKISSTLYNEYEKAYKNLEYKIIDFQEYIKNNYSWINDENTQRLIWLANYSAGHDGILPKVETKISLKYRLIQAIIQIFIILVIIFIGCIILCPRLIPLMYSIISKN